MKFAEWSTSFHNLESCGGAKISTESRLVIKIATADKLGTSAPLSDNFSFDQSEILLLVRQPSQQQTASDSEYTS
jgi:hypothetical protein